MTTMMMGTTMTMAMATARLIYTLNTFIMTKILSIILFSRILFYSYLKKNVWPYIHRKLLLTQTESKENLESI
jgi:hypothetical protein